MQVANLRFDIALFFNPPGSDNGLHGLFGIRTDVSRQFDKPLSVPLAVLPVFFRHMFNDRVVLAWVAIQPLVGSYPPSLIENLHQVRGKAYIDRVFDIFIGHARMLRIR